MTRGGAEAVLRITAEVRVLMASIPIVQVVEEERVEGRSVVLKVSDEPNLEGLSSRVDVSGVEVEETAPAETATIAFQHLTTALGEVLIDDVVVLHRIDICNHIGSSGRREGKGDEGLNLVDQGVVHSYASEGEGNAALTSGLAED